MSAVGPSALPLLALDLHVALGLGRRAQRARLGLDDAPGAGR
jgi:hypothetical protein